MWQIQCWRKQIINNQRQRTIKAHLKLHILELTHHYDLHLFPYIYLWLKSVCYLHNKDFSKLLLIRKHSGSQTLSSNYKITKRLLKILWIIIIRGMERLFYTRLTEQISAHHRVIVQAQYGVLEPEILC
jgi:hypothetical protein